MSHSCSIKKQNTNISAQHDRPQQDPDNDPLNEYFYYWPTVFWKSQDTTPDLIKYRHEHMWKFCFHSLFNVFVATIWFLFMQYCFSNLALTYPRKISDWHASFIYSCPQHCLCIGNRSVPLSHYKASAGGRGIEFQGNSESVLSRRQNILQ